MTHSEVRVSGGGDLGRAEALRLAGLSAVSDPGMDRFARLVARLLRVPVSLVSLVEADRQVFPGMVGLLDPWARLRQTPLTHSFCQHVVASATPLVIADTRADPRTRASPAIPDLAVIAYAGVPLTDGEGNVLGSLCAIDNRPRNWSDAELADLNDLAAACSGELRLRIVSQQSRSAHAETERGRQAAELLLRASEVLARCTSLEDVRRALDGLFDELSGPASTALLIADGDGLLRITDPDLPEPFAAELAHVPADAAVPSALALRTRRAVFVPDREALAARFGTRAVAAFDALEMGSALCLPLSDGLGVLALRWRGAHPLTLTERGALTAVAGYVAQAVQRALYVQQQVSVAERLQAAMLTDLPVVPGLEMAALYLPAADQEMVGGDWYDAYPLPEAAPDGPHPVMVTVGDVIGHDLPAATFMGQLRSMLRQATLDHPPHLPSTALSALGRTYATLAVGPGCTVVHARLAPGPEGWRLTWSSAGHLPPLLLEPGAEAGVRLEGNDIMLIDAAPASPRHDRHRLLPEGSVLLLYTDGLVERRDTDLDLAVDRLARQLARHAHQPLPRLLETLAAGLDGLPARDDVAVLAIRTGPAVTA
jgi:serine phosphatase RsbU (regulator of sigma subunit)